MFRAGKCEEHKFVYGAGICDTQELADCAGISKIGKLAYCAVCRVVVRKEVADEIGNLLRMQKAKTCWLCKS